MRKRTVVLCAATLTLVVAPLADALRIEPLRNRSGVVLTWRSQGKVAVVAQPNGRMVAIHSLRRVSPGSRVTVQGIKWGTPVAGIKWSTPARGIKWGIKWGRNGSYQSILRPSTKRAVWTPVRGPIVKRFGTKAIAVSTRGGIVVVRVARRQGTEGLPGQHSLNAVRVPPVGATVSMRVYFGRRGIKIARQLRYLKPPVPGAKLPVAGIVVSLDRVAKTMVLQDTQDRAYRVRIKVALPTTFSIAPFHLRQAVAAEGTLTTRGVIMATLAGPDGSFTQADSPSLVQVQADNSPCTQALDGCVPEPGTASGGTPPGGQTPPTSSGSTPTTTTPPPPGPPPPTGDGGDPPSTPPPPPSCLGAAKAAARHGAVRPPGCVVDWCHRHARHGGTRHPKCPPHRRDAQPN